MHQWPPFQVHLRLRTQLHRRNQQKHRHPRRGISLMGIYSLVMSIYTERVILVLTLPRYPFPISYGLIVVDMQNILLCRFYAHSMEARGMISVRLPRMRRLALFGNVWKCYTIGYDIPNEKGVNVRMLVP